MKTIGTLEEIGAQVGDVVKAMGLGLTGTLIENGGEWSVSNRIGLDFYGVKPEYTSDHNGVRLSNSHWWRIVTRAAKSPVRTVTRKEIVPGVYGKVNVADTAGQWIEIEFVGEYGHTGRPRLTASDLTAAIKTLTEIRDALQDNG